MRFYLQALIPVLLPFVLLSSSGCSCGFDCNNDDNDNNPASLTLGFSDSLPEDLKEVVLEVDTITLRRSGEDIVVDTFTISQLSLVDAATFQIDLLDYRGVDQLRVITGLELSTGSYTSIDIKVIADGVNSSYVTQADDTVAPLTVSGDVLQVPGMQLLSGSQTFTVEFSLAQALDLPAGSTSYRLTTTGIRTENNATAATLSGEVADTLFDTVTACSEKADPLIGNRVYLYPGKGLAKESLVDVYTSASTNKPPTNTVAPFAVASLERVSLTDSWLYSFGFVPAGDYTIAFSCNTADDDAIQWNDLVIPLPDNQTYEITLTEAQKAVCNLSDSGSC